jgi:hypothetical protein
MCIYRRRCTDIHCPVTGWLFLTDRTEYSPHTLPPEDENRQFRKRCLL